MKLHKCRCLPQANINSPISGFTFIVLFIFLDVHNPKTPFIKGVQAIDWFGSLFILAFTIMLLVGLELGGVTFPYVLHTHRKPQGRAELTPLAVGHPH